MELGRERPKVWRVMRGKKKERSGMEITDRRKLCFYFKYEVCV